MFVLVPGAAEEFGSSRGQEKDQDPQDLLLTLPPALCPVLWSQSRVPHSPGFGNVRGGGFGIRERLKSAAPSWGTMGGCQCGAGCSRELPVLLLTLSGARFPWISLFLGKE